MDTACDLGYVVHSAENEATWPRTITLYAHGQYANAYEDGKRLGLSDTAAFQLKEAINDIVISLEVYEDGSSKIVNIKTAKAL